MNAQQAPLPGFEALVMTPSTPRQQLIDMFNAMEQEAQGFAQHDPVEFPPRLAIAEQRAVSYWHAGGEWWASTQWPHVNGGVYVDLWRYDWTGHTWTHQGVWRGESVSKADKAVRQVACEMIAGKHGQA